MARCSGVEPGAIHVRLAPLLWYLGLTMLLLCIVTCREKDLQAQLGVQNRRLKFARSKQIQSNTKSKYDPRPLAIDWNQLPEGTQDVIEHQIEDFVQLVEPFQRAKHSTRLIRARVEPSTQRVYAAQVFAFAQYLREEQAVTTKNPIQSIQDLDSFLVDFAETTVDYIDNPSKYGTLLSAIQCFFPDCRGFLRKAWSAYAGWKKRRPGHSHPPLPYELLCLGIDYFLSTNDLDMASAIAAMSAGYLRASEACNALVDEYGPVSIERTSDLNRAFGVFSLPRTKAGRAQSALIRDESVHRMLLQQQERALNRGYKTLFNMHSTVFRRKFDEFLLVFGLRDSKYPRWVPHSLRHGAATYDFLKGHPFSDIKIWGRWSKDKTVLIYLQAGELSLNNLPLPLTLPKTASFGNLVHTLRRRLRAA